jgi:hypothetical protein
METYMAHGIGDSMTGDGDGTTGHGLLGDGIDGDGTTGDGLLGVGIIGPGTTTTLIATDIMVNAGTQISIEDQILL